MQTVCKTYSLDTKWRWGEQSLASRWSGVHLWLAFIWLQKTLYAIMYKYIYIFYTVYTCIVVCWIHIAATTPVPAALPCADSAVVCAWFPLEFASKDNSWGGSLRSFASGTRGRVPKAPLGADAPPGADAPDAAASEPCQECNVSQVNFPFCLRYARTGRC